MKRISLIPLAAALLLANPATGFAQEKTMTTSTGIELVWIPSGECIIGSTREEQDWAVSNKAGRKYVTSEGTPRKAIIRQGFWLGRTEVTVGQWKQFVAAVDYISDAEKVGEAYVPARPGTI